MKKWTSKMTRRFGLRRRELDSTSTRTVKVASGICALSVLTVVAGASLGVVSPVAPAAADEITPAPGVTISELPLPTPTNSLPTVPSLPTGGLPTDLPTGLPSVAIPPISTPDIAPKPADDTPYTGTDLNVNVGKSLTINTDASGEIQQNAFYVSTNVSGDGNGTVNVPVGPNKPRDVTSFAPLQVDNDEIIYDVDNQMPEVQNLLASMGQYGGDMPITVSTSITQDGVVIDPNDAKTLTGNIEVEWTFTNHTTSAQQISYRGPGGATVTESADISIPFGVGLTGTFGSGWANVEAPWANTGFAVGQVVSGSVQLTGSTVVAKLTGTADNAQLPEMKIKATPKDSTNATSALYSKGAEIGATVDDLLSGKGVPLLVKLQDGLGTASAQLSAFLADKVNPALEMAAKISINPDEADQKVAAAVDQLEQASDYLFMLNGLTESATATAAGYVADATSPASQKALAKMISQLGDAETALDQGIATATQLVDELNKTVIPGLENELKSPDKLVCETKPCTGASLIEEQIVGMLPGTCTAGDATRTYLDANWAAKIEPALDDALGKVSDPADLQKLKDLLIAQKDDNSWDVNACTAAANGIVAVTPTLIGDLSEISADIAGLLPLLEDVEDGIKFAEKSLTKLLAKMPELNYALDHDCSPAVISNISNCGLLQAMTIAAAADEASAKAVRAGVDTIVRELQEPLHRIYAIANDVGRGALPLEKAIDDLPGVINELANGPFGAITDEVKDLAGLASTMTTSASKTVAVNNAIDKKFHSGVAFPYGTATGADATTSATYAFTVASPGNTPVSVGVVAGFAGLLLIVLIGLTVWLSRRPNAI